MIVIPAKAFKKKVLKLPKRLQVILAKRIRLFMEDPFDILLNNHALSGSLRHYRSINITGDYRLIYELYDDETIRFIDIDTHAHLYGE